MPDPRGRRRVFCCVNDNGETCVRLTEVLNRCGGAGYDVICAGDAKSALWWASTERFDLFILDHDCPGSEGLELCREIRGLDPKTPIVFYANDAGDADCRLEGLAAGAQAYLVKPDIEELAVTALRLLAGNQAVAA